MTTSAAVLARDDRRFAVEYSPEARSYAGVRVWCGSFLTPSAACGLIRAVCVETHKGGLEDKRYINMELPWRGTKGSATKRRIDLNHAHPFAQLDEQNRSSTDLARRVPTTMRSSAVVMGHPRRVGRRSVRS